MPKFHVSRSIEIEATPDQVYQKVADFGTWTTWSPWLCADPDADVAVSSDAASVGSTYAWKGEIVGQGQMQHLSLEPGRSIEDELHFIKPFDSKSQVRFEFERREKGCKVSWHMNGSLPWYMFWMISLMKVFIGMDYERGLKMLKEWIETGEILSSTEIRGIESVGPLTMAGIRKTCPIHEVGKSMEQAFAEATSLFQKYNLPTDGGSISVYHKFDMKAQTFDYTSGFMIENSPSKNCEGLSTWSIPTIRALAVNHRGSYNNLGNAWSAANQYARYKKLKQSRVGTFELYRDCPDETAAKDVQTEIFLPLKS